MRWLALLVFPCLSGCLAVGYPVMTRTPLVAVGSADVRAFRVTSELWQSGPWRTAPISITGRVEEIPVVDATVPEQKDSWFAYSYLLFPITEGCHERSVRVLLYRPGFETMEVDEQGWWNFTGSNQPEGIIWREARDLAAQEKALERVVARNPIRWSVFDPGVLRFVSHEYTRLANSPLAAGPEMQQARERLLARAQECDKAANQAEKPEAEKGGSAEGQGSAGNTAPIAPRTPGARME